MKIGIIGAGFAAAMHSYAIRTSFPETEQFVFDIDQATAEAFAKKSCAIAVNNCIELLDNTDAVIISTPVKTHYSLAMEALKRKKHILCEKPMALTYPEAVEMYKTGEKNNIICAVGFNYRYFTITKLLKQERPIGDITKLNVVIYRLNRDEWHNEFNGVLSDLGTHLIDLVMFLCNQKINLSACTIKMKKRNNWDFDSSVFGKLMNGTEFQISAARIQAPADIKFRIEAEGKDGILIYDSRRMSNYIINKNGNKTEYRLELSLEYKDFFDFTDSILSQDTEWINLIEKQHSSNIALFQDGVYVQQALDYFTKQAVIYNE